MSTLESLQDAQARLLDELAADCRTYLDSLGRYKMDGDAHDLRARALQLELTAAALREVTQRLDDLEDALEELHGAA
ncbi:hypothetical protein [uncultured Meiothermus sp.]|jgi:hypothetical protein|uniref:hypothetical protein n=1 Tax=uncultured Meiothermus sp. TaxID=157471 RepID=UPI00261DE6FC|nr:hypothetical protein [uncultured Meiothermus sp.]